MSLALSNGVEQFFADYTRLPLPLSGAPAKGDLDTDSGPSPGLVTLLVGHEPVGHMLQNPRRISYLDGLKQAKPGPKSDGPRWVNGLADDTITHALSVVDCWGNFYHVRLDTDGDGWVENPNPEAVLEGLTKLHRRVLVWSPGKDGHEQTWSDNPISWSDAILNQKSRIAAP